MGSVQHKAKCAMHTKESVRTETSISHSILCALNTYFLQCGPECESFIGDKCHKQHKCTKCMFGFEAYM